MRKKTLCILLAICSLLLMAELAFIGFMNANPGNPTPQTTVPESTVSTTAEPGSTETDPEITTAPTQTEPVETEPQETEPQEIRYVLTFVGDCTLGSTPDQFSNPNSFVSTVGEDYGYPFRNVLEYFENDDFTMINLEGVFADSGNPALKTFTFRGPTAYTQILTSSSVEAVTLANNHTEDFGKEGYNTTVQVLSEAGIYYVEQDRTQLVTTESGLVIGLYADAFSLKKADIERNIQALRDAGAEIIICAFHWGAEGSYRANHDQQVFARHAIDCGADIVYGHHPHVLQKIEEYNGGIIYYSLGNFSFGGNTFPRDMDSAIVQQEVIRDLDGNVRLGELTIIPVSLSSREVQNNFQPTPYPEGSEEYKRVLSKLDGTFTGPNLVVNYGPEETEPPTDPGPGETEPGGEGGGATQPPVTEGPGPEDTPGDGGGDVTPPPADEGGSGDSGSSGGEQTPPPPADGGDSGAAEG